MVGIFHSNFHDNFYNEFGFFSQQQPCRMVSATRSKIQQLFTENPRRLCIKVYGSTQENNDITHNTDNNTNDGKILTTQTAFKYGCRVSLEKHNNNNNTIHMNNGNDVHRINNIKSSGGGVKDGGDVDDFKCILLEKWEVDVVNKR